MDTLIGALCAVSGKDHPDRAEFRGAMVSDHRRAIIVAPTSVIGAIGPVWR